MESSDSKSPAAAPKITSDKLVDMSMQKGFEDILVKTTAGFVVGGVVGIVLARVTGSSGARRAWAGLGGGIGLGSGWARTSLELEKIVGSKEE
jgi:hypothetical protein